MYSQNVDNLDLLRPAFEEAFKIAVADLKDGKHVLLKIRSPFFCYEQKIINNDDLRNTFRIGYSFAQSEIKLGRLVTISLKHSTRTLEINACMWAMLADVSKQVDWYGNKLTSEEWKDVFTAGLKKLKVVPGIDGGVVILGQSTSQMSQSQMREVIQLIEAFGAEYEVKFSAPKSAWEGR